MPRYSSAGGEAQQRVEGVLNGVDFEGPRRAVGVGQFRKRRSEPEPVVARDAEGQDPGRGLRPCARHELYDVRVEPRVPVSARP